MPTQSAIPQIGMLATVRNRRGLITSVDASTSQPSGVWHLVNLIGAENFSGQVNTRRLG